MDPLFFRKRTTFEVNRASIPRSSGTTVADVARATWGRYSGSRADADRRGLAAVSSTTLCGSQRSSGTAETAGVRPVALNVVKLNQKLAARIAAARSPRLDDVKPS